MSMPAIARLLPLCLMLNACTSTPRTSAPAAPAIEPDYPQGQALFHGTLTRHGTKWLFRQCGNPDTWQFQPDEAMRQQWQRLGNPPQVYAELEGELTLDEARGAPFRLRPGRLNLLATSEDDACQRDPAGYAWRAFGTDPDWRLSLQGAQAVLTTPAAPRTAYRLLEQRPQPDGGMILQLQDAAGQPAQWQLSPQPCTDSRTGTLRGYRASLNGARQSLSGCAERGRPLLALQPEQHWQGQVPYPDSQVALTLQANYQASLTYLPTRGPQVLYEGVWQPTRDGLTLLFNRRLGRGVREGIPFRQLGSRLSADYRLLNGGEVDFEPPLQLQPGSPGLPSATVMTPKAAAVTDLRSSSRQAARQPDTAIVAALQAWLSSGPDAPSRLRYRYLKYDLNEDGQEDALVQLGSCRPSGCDWLILEGQGGGYRPLGTMSGFQGPLLVAPERQQGWHALLVQPQFERWVSLHFNGGGYPSSTELAQEVPTPDSRSHVQLLFNTGDWLSLN